MLTEELKSRLSRSFSAVEENISMCRTCLEGSSIPASKKEEILHDFSDIEKIMGQRSFEDVNAIEEAIIALADVKAYCDRIRDEQQFKEYVTHTLRLLNYIKKLLSNEGLVPDDIGILEDRRPRNGSTRPTAGHSSFAYIDDTGTPVHLFQLEEYMYPSGLNHIFRF